jgi:glycosyltransferase involved in cell wall biosynthesis
MNIIKQENKGVSGARNTGIANVRGEYICFVDVDDGLKPDYLSFMYDVIRRKNVPIVLSKFNTSQNERKEIGSEQEYSSREALKRYLYHEQDSGLYRLMISADIIQKNHLRFAEGYKYGEDVHMVWKMLHFCGKIVETDRVLYIHRVNEGSAMSRFDQSRMDSIRLLEDLERFFEVHNPEFYPLFKKYAKARMAWAILWQATAHLDYKDFINFIDSYHLRGQMKNLLNYRQKHVALSCWLFLFSDRLYYWFAKKASRYGGI